jgi:hypothetical protein
MNTLGQYDDGRSNYSFNFSDNDGKHMNISFRAEYYDLDIIFQEFRNFLIASGHDIEGEIGEVFQNNEDYDDSDEVHAMTQAQAADKFSMDHLPNNGWPFGGLTTTDISALTSPHDWSKVNQYPTMAPITSQQIQSWSLSTEGIQSLTVADLSSWKMDAPGTLGGAKVTFGDPKNDWSPRSKDYQK